MEQYCGAVSEWELWRIGGWSPLQLNIKTNLTPTTALYIKCLESFMHSKANSFSLESQASVIFIKKILIFFWSISLEEFIFTVTLRHTNVNLLIRISLKNQANTLDNTRKTVYYETHPKHRKQSDHLNDHPQCLCTNH